MGLGPLMAIYQARFLRYLHGPRPRRHLASQGLGVLRRRRDGRAGIARRDLACRPREARQPHLCHQLQSPGLDGPVRGNGKIVQELEADFRGAGWNVIKCLWGSGWDALLAKDHEGKLRQLMFECVDGEYQDFKSKMPRISAKNFLVAIPRRRRWSRINRRRDLGADPRRARSGQGLCRLQGCGRS